MRASVIYEYLELFCYGSTLPEIARKYTKPERAVREGIVTAARKVGQLDFWKFHSESIDEVQIMRRRILDLMHRHGLTGWRTAA